MPFDKAAAKRAGYSDAEIDAYLAGNPDDKTPAEVGAMSPEEMFGPRGMTRRFSRAIPYVAGMGGAMLGGLRGPMGARAGAVIGGGAGRAAERALFNEPQSAADILGAGAEQGGLETVAQLIGGIPGAISKGAGRMSGFLKGRAAEQAVVRSRAANAAGDMSADIAKAIPEARASRQAAGADISHTLKANAGADVVTLKEVIDDVLAKTPDLPDAAKKRLLKDMREEFRAVIPEFTRGGMSGREVTFNIGDANHAKRAFDIAARKAHKDAAAGVFGNPDLRRDISNAFRSLIEDRVPAMRGLNARYQDARIEDQGLRKMERGQPTGRVGDIRQLRRERIAAALAQLPGEGGLPVDVGLGGIRPRIPRTAAAADAIKGFADDPLTRAGFNAAGQAPRAIDLIMQLLSSPDYSAQGGTP